MKVKLLYLFLFFSFSVFSQQKKTASFNFKNTDLITVLTQLEKTFNVHFSYQLKNLDKKTINLSVKDKSLKELLKYLNNETSLIFESISSEFIAVRQLNDIDKISICGYIKSPSNIPLSGSTITFNNKGLITDENGFFKIKSIKSETSISIQFLGFENKILVAKNLYNNKCKTITLNEASEQMTAIVIKNYLTNGIDKTKEGSFIIAPNKLGIFAGLTEPDLFQSIQLLPGVNSPNETATGLHVRGGTPDQNLVIWDGINIYHSGHLFGAFSPFNPYITKEINFINKGTNARFGDRVSSVIDIKTEDDLQSKTTGGFGLNLIATDAYIKLPVIKDKFSVIGSFRRSLTDIFQSKAYEETSDIIFKSSEPNTSLIGENNLFFTDFNLKAIFKFNKNNHLTVSSLLVENKLDFSLKEIDDETTEKQDDKIDSEDFLETDNRGFSFAWYKKWNSNFEQNIKGYYSNYYLLYNKFRTENIDERAINLLTFAKKNDIIDVGFSYDVNYKINTTNSLKVGYQFSNKDVSYFFLIANDGNGTREDSNAQILSTHVLYTSFEITTKMKLNLSLGIRGSYYQNFQKMYIEPRINIGKYITPHLRLNITGEYKTQALSQIDETVESGLALENKLWSVADNDKFPIITATQFTAGFSYVKNNWQIEIDTYYKKINGLVTLNFGFSDVFDNDAHLGESTIKGLDFYVKKKFENYSSWLSYTFDDTQNLFKDINNDLPFSGNANIKHNFYWSHTYKWQRFDFALGWRWHSGKPYSKAIAIVTNSSGKPALKTDGINKFNLPIYNRLDFSATYNFTLSKTRNIKAKIGLSYLNILNKENILSRDFFINSNTNQINSARKVSLERISNFVFRVNF